MEEKARHIIAVLQDVNWKEISKDAMLKIVDQLELYNITSKSTEDLKIRLKKDLEVAHYYLKFLLPKPRLEKNQGSPTPTVVATLQQDKVEERASQQVIRVPQGCLQVR